MPYPFNLNPPNYADFLKRIQEAAYETVAELQVQAWISEEPLPFAERKSGVPATLALGRPWGKQLFDCAWMHFSGIVPDHAAGKRIVALIDFNGEGLVVDKHGEPAQGITTVSSQYDFRYGFPGKRVVPLLNPAAGGEPVDLWVDAANNDLFGIVQNSGALQQARIAILHPELLALRYDLDVLVDLAAQLDAKSARVQRLRAKLYEATRLLRDYTDAEAGAARAVLAPELAKRGGDASLTFSAVGHAHMDLGWLWPIRETKRKCARTFSTVLAMMDRYPDYLFGASQPQQYQWVKEEYPGLYARIKEKVAEGRWELQGAMWVEPDTNITGGESLIRQIIYGKRFFREEFGFEPDNLWEPDVFGYTGALPQILAKSGVKYFMTQKLSWNEINTFPHQTFWWEGIDGSRVLAHMLPEENYLSAVMPRSLRFAEYNYFDSPVSDRALVLFGIGDGGGGPGEEHLESLARVTNLEGLCPMEQEFAETFFHRLDANAGSYAAWRGELYLEKHQGTLTSQARSKRYNRKLEYLLREVELSAVWAMQADSGYAYPSEQLDTIWREVLLYQFHDILPGSSITRVYDESLARYAVLQKELENLRADADAVWARAASGQTLLLNSLSWDRAEWLKIDGSWAKVHLPALSSKSVAMAAEPSTAFDGLLASDSTLENDLLRVVFASDGTISSIYDKQTQREVLVHGEAGNAFHLYDDDQGTDAWDFRIDYDQRPPVQAKLVRHEAFTDGPQSIRRGVYGVGKHSTIHQEVVLTLGSRRIDFKTRVDWREVSKMLRTSFPVEVQSNTMTCDIQFGSIQRSTTNNTSWDAAVHEIAAHKWVDLSEPGYGVALLNDCKYGHRVKGKILDLNLLRNTSYPDPVGDHAQHEFTYALLPHQGDAVAANIRQEGYALNIPIRPVAAQASAAQTKPFGESWLTVTAPNIIVETVKRGEDASGLIVRLYESTGSRTKTRLTFAFDTPSIALTDLVEQNPQSLQTDGRTVELEFGPFEIHTLKLS